MKIRDIPKIEKKKNSIGISVFGYKNKEKYQISVLKKCYVEKHSDQLLIREEGKTHYSLIKDLMFSCMTILYIGGKISLLLLLTSF